MSTNFVSIVTGGGRGIGRSIALRLAKETAVLVIGRTASDLESVCAEIRASGGVADYLVGDVSDPATAQHCLQKVSERGWTIRHLVCNAGIGKGGPSATFDKDAWREIFAVNVHGSFWLIQACLPAMVAQKSGTICLISSIAGIKGFKYQAAYCASKHAIVGLARSLALEYAKHGIVVVPLCPSFVESNMTRRTIAGVASHRGLSAAEAEKIVAGKNPQQRIIPAAEVAEMVSMVCSGKVPALNGNPLILSGGE
jgi:NAD(P)-dependent dehydrogenase (short-subunit alcohol dehydrogenase family)